MDTLASMNLLRRDKRGVCLHAGVNPMITVEALAYMVAEGLAKDFRQQTGRDTPPAHPVLAATQPEE